jgi:Uma2 family endonuclease
MALATPKQFTVDDYHRLGEIGLIAPNERTELLEGTIYLKELATPKQFTVEDYYRLGEVGMIQPDERTELLDGVIYPMEPIGPFHGGVGASLEQYFWQLSNGRWIVRSQYPIRLNNSSEPQPDIALVKPASHQYKRRHPTPADVFLVIEISDTSLDVDRGLKLPLYGRATIPEYWIVNLQKEVIEVYRKPHPSGYSVALTYKAGEKISPAQFPDVEVDVAELFRRAD